MEAAGACALVLEAVPSEAARRVTEALRIPTIGIGAGPHCDGQVLVSTEMLGLSAGNQPEVREAIRRPPRPGHPGRQNLRRGGRRWRIPGPRALL